MENNNISLHKVQCLPEKSAKDVVARLQSLALKLEAAKSAMTKRISKMETASINSPAKRVIALKKTNLLLAKKRSKICPTRLSSLHDLKYSVLRNLASYRLTTNFVETGTPITDLNYAHNICPHDYICLPDLIGTCTDKKCLYQHQSNYIMTDIEKLADILSYRPSITGFKMDPNLSEEENYSLCRVKLKQYAAKMIAKNPDKLVETIARNLADYVRRDISDHDILSMTRELPKVSNLVVQKPSAESNVSD